MLIRRTIAGPDAIRTIRRWVDIPSGIALAVAWVCFAIGGAFDDPQALYRTAEMEPMNGWIRGYWFVLSAITGYLVCFAIRDILILRTEQRHRPVADIYLFACVPGLTASVAGAYSAAAHGYLSTPLLVILATSDILWIGGFAVGAAYSWRRKVEHFTNGMRPRSSVE